MPGDAGAMLEQTVNVIIVGLNKPSSIMQDKQLNIDYEQLRKKVLDEFLNVPNISQHPLQFQPL